MVAGSGDGGGGSGHGRARAVGVDTAGAHGCCGSGGEREEEIK